MHMHVRGITSRVHTPASRVSTLEAAHTASPTRATSISPSDVPPPTSPSPPGEDSTPRPTLGGDDGPPHGRCWGLAVLGGPRCRAMRGVRLPAPPAACQIPPPPQEAVGALGARSAPGPGRAGGMPERERVGEEKPGQPRAASVTLAGNGPAPSRKQGEDPAPLTSPPARTACASRARAWPPLARSRNRLSPTAPAMG